jgi:hypothetical protein
MTRRRGRGVQPSAEISEEEETGNMGDHNEERNERDDDSVLHILNDLAKGQNEMKETFARG